MFKWSHFPFVRFAISLSIGIIFYGLVQIPIIWVVAGALLLFLTFLLLFRSIQKTLKGIVAISFLVLTGYFIAFLEDPFYKQDHIIHQSDLSFFMAQIEGMGKVRNKFVRYPIRVLSDSLGNSIEGKLFLYVKDSVIRYRSGYEVICNGLIQEINDPEYPHEFDYRKFTMRRGYFGNIFVEPEAIYISKSDNRFHILWYFEEYREDLSRIIEFYLPNSSEQQVAKAMILGEKDDLSDDIRQSYATSGAMHILAVSGLHVGIIYIIVSSFLSVFLRHPRYKFIKLFLILVSIVCYAFITGLSVSVLRAALMFSLIAIGKAIFRKSSVYNSLGIAAFILLVINPNFIYEVGFQLSFLAVFGIVAIYPVIYPLVSSRFWLVDKIWSISCVSMAAQISTVPLTIYYFHQFPTYFLLANLFVIPGAFMILTTGLTLLLFHFLGFPYMEFISTAYEYLIYGFNHLIFLTEKLPGSLVSRIHVSTTMVISIYSSMILLGLGMYYRSFISILSGMVALIVFIFGLQLLAFENKSHRGLYVYGEKYVIIDDVENIYIPKEVTFDSSLIYKVEPWRISRSMRPIQLAHSSQENFHKEGPLLWNSIQGQTFLSLNEEAIEYNLNQTIHVDYLIAGQYMDLIEKIDFRRLIISPGFHKTTHKLRSFAELKGVPVYDLNEKGFIDLNK